MNSVKKFVLVPESEVKTATDIFFNHQIENENKVKQKDKEIFDDLSKILSLNINQSYKMRLFNTLLNKVLDKKPKTIVEKNQQREEYEDIKQTNEEPLNSSFLSCEENHEQIEDVNEEEEEKQVEDSLRKIIKFDRKGRIIKGAVPVKSTNIRRIAKYIKKPTSRKPQGLNLLLNRLKDKEVQKILESSNIQWQSLKRL